MLYAIHGFTETDLSWADVLEPTHIQYRTVLLPGHGSQPCAEDETIPACAARIAAEMGNDAIDLIGYSMGGRIALQLALDHPARVRRLILVSCCPGIADASEREARCKQDDALAELLLQDGIGTFVAWWENQPTMRAVSPIDPTCMALLRSRRLNQDPELLACAIRTLGQGHMPSLWQRLGELTMPVLLIGGAGDDKYAGIMRAMHEGIRDSQLELIEHCGHAVHREQAKELIRRTLDFLIES